jgi:hypothetical protein
MNSKPLASAGRLVRSLVRKPGGSGIAIAAVTIPLIFLVPDASGVIVFAALLIYPFVDPPRTLGGRSWWRAALIGLAVWFIVFVVLIGIVETVRPLGEDAMAFLAPFMLYPFALALAGLVRLEGRLNARPPESGPRIAARVIGLACAVLVVGPFLLGMIPALQERITGNTAENFSYSYNGEVVSATPERVTVRFDHGEVESILFGPDTQFSFWGPGSPLAEGEAGPSWLTAGQHLGVRFVYRSHEATASDIHIWIDRKGCARDEQWIAAGESAASPSPEPPSLTATTWEGTMAVQFGPEPVETTTFEFLPGQQLAYQDRGRERYTNGHWRQNGAVVLIEINDCYAKYEGTIAGSEIKGEYSNEIGARTPWTAHRK